MKKWSCNGTVTGGKFLGIVEAETKEEAIEKAWQLDTCYVSLCYQCSHEMDDPDIQTIEVEEQK